MSELDNLFNDIEELRKNLLIIVQNRENDFQDPEVMAASEILNVAIVKYTELLKRKLANKT